MYVWYNFAHFSFKQRYKRANIEITKKITSAEALLRWDSKEKGLLSPGKYIDILLKANNERGKSLFEGIVELAHKLRIKVICEGVETEEQKGFVQNSNCDYIQ